MTTKEKRINELDALKNASSAVDIRYCVEITNYGREPMKTFSFRTMEDANKAYNRLEYEYFNCGMRKYAVVPF